MNVGLFKLSKYKVVFGFYELLDKENFVKRKWCPNGNF